MHPPIYKPKNLPIHLITAALLLACSSKAQTTSLPSLEGSALAGAHHILVLGDSITYSGQYIDDLEAFLRIRGLFGGLDILDLGLPSETVSGLSEPGHAGGKFPRPDLHERLDRVLAKTKPDLVIACYGMNDGIYYPFGEDRFQKFQDGIRWLHERVTQTGARIIHITPPTFDPFPIKGKTLPAGLVEYRKPYEGYNDVLDRYSAWLVSQRTNGWTVIDAHTPMNNYLAEQRRENPGFVMSRDGVHPDDAGHWVIARALIEGLNLPKNGDAFDLTHFQETSATGEGAALLKLIHQKNRLLSDAWLTDAGHKRPGMNPGLPPADAQAKAAELVPQIEAAARAVTGASR
jgi:lysophospholipase L1-like esterase